MVPNAQDSPRVHDLLLLRSGIVSSAGAAKPAWVTSDNAGNLWVVVRRTMAPNGLVAVGIRGINRHERWGGFADLADVKERIRPSQLYSRMASRTRIGLSALVALFLLELQLDKLDKSQLDWGPVGSVGFELATGQQMVTATSDLDLALFAPTRFTRETARDLWSVMSVAPAKVDVRVETPYCGFSLEEYAREGTKQILVRLPACRKLAADPWAISVIEDAA
jgi:phosphoribosyl-dephospho-CoA transferase